MKTIKFSTLFLALGMLLFASCVKDDDYELPDVGTKLLEFNGDIVSVNDIIKASSSKVTTYTKNDAIEGYVISSDEGGNFYKDIYIQALDGSDGFIVSINKSGLYGEYPLGTKVQVRLKDLSTVLVNGKLEIGYGVYKTTSVGQMPTSIYPSHVVNMGESIEFKTLAQVSSTLDALAKDENLNMLLRFENIAFESSAMGQTYHVSSNDKIYGTNYNLLDSIGGTVPFRTSLYAKYNKEIVPSELVNITGVLTKYRDDYQFMISNIEDVEIIEGTDGKNIKNSNFVEKTVTKLEETFKDVKNGEAITLAGWYSEAVKGNRTWQGKIFKDNTYISITGYKSNLTEMETWIVTPGLDLNNATNKNFTFDSQTGFSKKETLEVYISKDFNHKKGIEAATWEKLDATLANKNTSGYSGFVNAGDIDLSNYSGVVYVGFKYTGNGSDASGSWNIENVKFNYTPTSTGGEDPSGTSKTVTELDETFDAVTANEDVTLDGWIFENTKGTNTKWQGKEYNNNKYVQISAYKSNDAEVVAWMVTPGLDLNNATNKNFSFDTNRGHSKAEILEVLISTDYDAAKGVEAATWTALTATLAEANASGYGSFTNSGDIDLSSYSGVVYVAFKYTGNNSDATGTYQVENVKFNYTAGSDPSSGSGGGTTSNTTTTTENTLFSGSDFEDWSAFKGSLNKYGVKDYVTQSDNGKDGSKALHINGTPAGNDYVFTAIVPADFSTSDKKTISFYIKGTSPDKSLSVNLYKDDNSYYTFNLGDCSSSNVTITSSEKNSYSGSIDTDGKWVKVILDIAGLTDIATTKGNKLFAIKIGKKSTYDLLIDEITLE